MLHTLFPRLAASCPRRHQRRGVYQDIRETPNKTGGATRRPVLLVTQICGQPSPLARSEPYGPGSPQAPTRPSFFLSPPSSVPSPPRPAPLAPHSPPGASPL